jgi:nitric oxide reductase subunit B
MWSEHTHLSMVEYWRWWVVHLWVGMLGIGLMLFCMRGLKPEVHWNDSTLAGAFWALNIGLVLMALLTLLPMGVLQLQAALENGYWYARSAEFMGKPIIHVLVWMRVPGDTVFSIGAQLVAWFVFRLWISPQREGIVPVGPIADTRA